MFELCFLCPQGSAGGSCPSGWTSYRRRCYAVSSSVASWASADRTCSLLFNSSLSSVRSRRDVSWLWKLAGKKPFWIGQPGGSDLWTRSAGHSFFKLRGAPADSPSGGSDCPLVKNPRSWIPTNCSAETQHPFVCSISL
ncbi:early activation antigen CD69-like [Leuresthes tenuis]|uniref:early activation antigen CD69-like n=1 Tax=Leuresthes tenuis TaxID=355514 RepID=UPI003B50151C